AEGQLPEIVTLIINTIATQPSVLGLNLLLFLGILMFTDTSSGKGRWNYIVGAIHGLLHLVNLYFLTWLFSRLNLHHWEMSVGSWDHVLLFSGEMILVGGITSAVIFGIYLLFSISLLDNHITEASSSFRWEGYKNFLRIHVTQKGITIYPVGVEKVVTNWKNTGTAEKPKFEGDAIDCSLIEDPIEIFHKP
ncbi:MAG TPA: hypothetical protein VKZ51_06840, partial [Cyclobacteriaceae bacterium]|nr:hypothetical protein [Cyclobacteriaceae bacterium]